MANYVLVDKFESEISRIFRSFDICSFANEWTNGKKDLIIGTCFSGVALEVYKSKL